MRKIKKFRVWDKENNRFYKPTYQAYKGNLEELVINPNGRLFLRKIDCFEDESLFENRFVLMQYTGLKDKNGKDVYEDDVVLVNLIGKEILKEYKNYSFRWKANMVLGDDDAHNIANLDSKCLEVIGNIYENPELAK